MKIRDEKSEAERYKSQLKETNHRRDFDEFRGVWTAQELMEFREKIMQDERVDPVDWV